LYYEDKDYVDEDDCEEEKEEEDDNLMMIQLYLRINFRTLKEMALVLLTTHTF
jgi:hypothetical protein